MKRDMWSVLRNVAVGKAVVITTRERRSCLPVGTLVSKVHADSMEEASALANKAGILATRMLGKLKYLNDTRRC